MLHINPLFSSRHFTMYQRKITLWSGSQTWDVVPWKADICSCQDKISLLLQWKSLSIAPWGEGGTVNLLLRLLLVKKSHLLIHCISWHGLAGALPKAAFSSWCLLSLTSGRVNAFLFSTLLLKTIYQIYQGCRKMGFPPSQFASALTSPLPQKNTSPMTQKISNNSGGLSTVNEKTLH